MYGRRDSLLSNYSLFDCLSERHYNCHEYLISKSLCSFSHYSVTNSLGMLLRGIQTLVYYNRWLIVSSFLYSFLLTLPSSISHLSSSLLCFSMTVGGFGVDRFYLGLWQTGLGKLFSFGGLGVWTILDVILVATGYLTPADGSAFIY